jgi:hypothetical protein
MHPALVTAVAAARRHDQITQAATARRARQARRARRAGDGMWLTSGAGRSRTSRECGVAV